MVKKLLCVALVVSFSLFLSVPVTTAGVEPSPFFPNIGLIQSRLTNIGLSFPTLQGSVYNINLRLNTLLNDWVTPELATKGNDIIDRISENLANQQLDPDLYDSAVQLVTTMDRISWVLFDPQPEPPGIVTQGFTIIDRISWVLFDPQPEPPGLPADLKLKSIRVMYQVANVITQASINGLQQGTIPGLNAMEQLSGHLVDAAVRGKTEKAAAQVNALSRIAEQYAVY